MTPGSRFADPFMKLHSIANKFRFTRAARSPMMGPHEPCPSKGG
jgi:hypothetical protein